MRQAFALLLAMFLSSSAHSQEWTRFRGPNGSGVSTTTTLPTKWTENDYAWKTDLPGKGHSSPVVWGDRIFVTAGEGKTRRLVLCVDARDGKILWQREFPAKAYKTHARNSIATSTPAVDAERVYLLWATPAALTVMALDHQGKDVWSKDLGDFQGNHGIGVSPIIYDNLLIVPNDQDKQGSLLALDCKTGAKVWEVPRKSGNATYATPVVYNRGEIGEEIIFSNWKHGITAVEPKTGKIRWEISCYQPDLQERAIVSPVIAGDLVLGTCGFVTAQKRLVAVRPVGTGKGEEVWRIEKLVAHLATPLVKDEYVYSCTEKGILTCLEVRTGKMVWEERVDSIFYASPVWAGGYLYCTSDEGEVLVVKAGPKFELVSRNKIGGPSQATPAIANGQIIFRTENQLLCLRGKKK